MRTHPPPPTPRHSCHAPLPQNIVFITWFQFIQLTTGIKIRNLSVMRAPLVLFTSRAMSVLKPKSWTYNFAEVSGHNLVIFQTWVSTYNVYITNQSPYFFTFMGPRNRFQGMNSASLCSLAGRYDNPIPPRFLAPIDCLNIPAQFQTTFAQRQGGRVKSVSRGGCMVNSKEENS